MYSARDARKRGVGLLVFLCLAWGVESSSSAATAKPYADTTVKVVVDSGAVRYALGLLEDALRTQHGITLAIDVIPERAFLTKTLLEFTSGRSAWDLIVFDPTHFADYARHFEPLEPYSDKTGVPLHLDDIPAVFKHTTMYWGGTLYAMPLDGDIHLMFYNKAAFERPENKQKFQEQFGYALAPPQTWQQWDDMAKFFSGRSWDGGDKPLFGAGASLREDLHAYFWWRQRFFAYGGQYFDADMKPLINTKPGVRALQELLDTIPYYPPGVLSFAAEEPQIMLIKGEIPMLVSWSSTGKRIADATQSLIVEQAGYSVLPGHQTNGAIRRAVPNTGGRALAVSAYATAKEAAALVLAFVSSPEHSLALVMDPQTQLDPWRTSHLTSEAFRTAWPGAAAYLDAIQASFSHAVPDLQIPSSSAYRRQLSAMITKALRKQLAPQEALDQAATIWRGITKRRQQERQQQFWRQQLAVMEEAGITFQPELAEP